MDRWAREPWFTLSNDALCVYFLNAGIVILLWSTKCFFLSPSLNKKPVSFHNIAGKCYMLITTTTVFINNFIKVYFFYQDQYIFILDLNAVFSTTMLASRTSVFHLYCCSVHSFTVWHKIEKRKANYLRLFLWFWSWIEFIV